MVKTTRIRQCNEHFAKVNNVDLVCVFAGATSDTSGTDAQHTNHTHPAHPRSPFRRQGVLILRYYSWDN